MSGSWWDASRSGEGQFITFESTGTRRVVYLAYFTYIPDGRATRHVGNQSQTQDGLQSPPDRQKSRTRNLSKLFGIPRFEINRPEVIYEYHASNRQTRGDRYFKGISRLLRSTGVGRDGTDDCHSQFALK
jgi:hypothetical protein